MMHRLPDGSAERFVLAIEENLYSWVSVFGAIWSATSNDPIGVKRSICPLGFSFFSSIVDTHLEPENVEAAIQRIKSDADARQVPALWWIGPSTQPADLGQQLVKHGFAIDEDGQGMAVDLLNLNEHLPVADDTSIEQIDDAAALTEWAHTMGLGFEAPATRIDNLVETWSDFLRQVNPDVVQAYLARLNGRPVATSLLLLGGGAAGIYSVATIREARRMGIGAQVTLFPLLQARSRGYRIGILQSSKMGHGVYQSLGFRDYCRITSYVYHPIKS